MWMVIKLFFFFLLATVLHWAFTAVLGGVGVSLNFMLVFAIAVCACMRPEYGYPTAFVCGLFLDFFGVKLFGHNALIFTLCAALVYGLENRVDFGAVLPQMVCVFVLELLAALGSWFMLDYFAGFSAWNGLGPLLGGTALCAVLAPGVFWVISRVFEDTGKTTY